MIGSITDLHVYSKLQNLDDSTTFVFSFTKVSGDVGGYVLHYSEDNVTYTQLAVRIDSIHNPEDPSLSTYTDGASVYFNVSLDASHAGKLYYFKAKVVSTTKEESTFSNIVIATTFPTKPNGHVIYDGLSVKLQWEIPTEGGINSIVDNVSVESILGTEINVSELYLTDFTLYCTKFVVGEYAYVEDKSNHIFWFGQITTEGLFVLDSNVLISDKHSISEDYVINVNNLGVFVTTSSSLVHTYTISNLNYFEVSDYIENTMYFFRIRCINIDSTYGNAYVYPIYTLGFELSYPYLRPIYATTDENMSQPDWRLMKEALVDENYYDKAPFTIPYFQDYLYTFQGYLGIANAKIDIFVGDSIYTTITTNDNGEFIFTYMLPYGYTYFKFQARSVNNEKFSRTSSYYKIHTVTMYTFLQVFGKELNYLRKSLKDMTSYISLRKSPYQSFNDIFVPYTGLYKLKGESDESFKNITQQLFSVFEFSSFHKGLEDLLKAFADNVETLDHFNVYYNYQIYQTLKTGYTFVSKEPKLDRKKWYYGISSGTLSGEETDISTIVVDTRWWPVDTKRFITLQWKHSIGAECYNVYRGESLSSLAYLTTVRGTVFCDNGELQPNSSIQPIFYNFTSIRKPENVEEYINIALSKFETRLKKNNFIVIILYAIPGSEVSDDHLQRIKEMLLFAIPPEIAYTLIYASDTTSEILS